MGKFIKRLFTLLILGSVGFLIWGYFNGMRMNNTQEFISSIFSGKGIPESAQKNLVQENQETVVSSEPTEEPSVSELLPLPENPFESIDKHARKCPESETKTVKTLATYLMQKAKTDEEKSRAIYVWLAQNISYNDEEYNTGVYKTYNTEDVLLKRTSVCEGYSNLYLALATEMNLEAIKISGYSKGYGYTEGEKFGKTDHAWNAVKINGAWKIVDATWGTGYTETVNGKASSVKEFSNDWFNVEPAAAVFTHFPESASNLFLEQTITLADYQKMPCIRVSHFHLGFDANKTLTSVLKDPTKKIAEIYEIETHVEIVNAPEELKLSRNKTYDFEIYVPRGFKAAMIDSKSKWHYFTSSNGIFKSTFKPTELGELKLSVKYEGSGKSFYTLVEYEVE